MYSIVFLAHDQIVVHPYRTPSKFNQEVFEALPGDIIGIAGNHWNGFSKGKNKRTGRVGLYPSARIARENWRIVDFPVFAMP